MVIAWCACVHACAYGQCSYTPTTLHTQDGARQVLRLARMLGVLPELPLVSPSPQASSSAFCGGEEEEAREEAERRREQEVGGRSHGVFFLGACCTCERDR